MRDKNINIYIVGAGSFAQKLSIVLDHHDIAHAFVDEQQQEDFCGKTVFSSSALRIQDGEEAYFFISISFAEYADHARARLQRKGISESRIYSLRFDSDTQIFDEMLKESHDKFLTHLATSKGCFIDLQRAFFADAYAKLGLQPTSADDTTDETSTYQAAKIAFQSVGRGGGYTKHFGGLPSKLSKIANCFYVSDSLHNETDLPHIPMSQSAMLKQDGVDLVVAAHVFVSSPKTVKRLSLMHMVHDVLLFEAQTIEYLEAFSTNYLFCPSRQSFKMYQQLCLEHRFSNNIVLIPGGYPRHDRNLEIYRSKLKQTPKKNCILYAPTLSSIHGSNEIDACFSIIQAAEFLPKLLESQPQLTLLFRPHPEDLKLCSIASKHPRMTALKKLLALCEEHPRCEIDHNQTDYLASFARSSAMLTDTSSVGMSYALVTQKPLIFFSEDHSTLLQFYHHSEFIKERPNIGYLAQSLADIETLLNDFKKSHQNEDAKHEQLAQFLFNPGQSEAYLLANFEYILKDVKHPDWWYLQDHLCDQAVKGVI